MTLRSFLPYRSQFAEAELCNSKYVMTKHATEWDPEVSFVHSLYLPKTRRNIEDNRSVACDAVSVVEIYRSLEEFDVSCCS